MFWKIQVWFYLWKIHYIVTVVIHFNIMMLIFSSVCNQTYMKNTPKYFILIKIIKPFHSYQCAHQWHIITEFIVEVELRCGQQHQPYFIFSTFHELLTFPKKNPVIKKWINFSVVFLMLLDIVKANNYLQYRFLLFYNAKMLNFGVMATDCTDIIVL